MSGYRFAPIPAADAVSVTFDGRALPARRGETLAATLIANGVAVVGRSFKYHRPRGIVGAGLDEPNAMVATARVPNILATRLAVADGLAARAVNCWPSARCDLRAIHDRFARLMPAGFYYKTFMGPGRGAWDFFERHIRRAAGLARVPTRPIDHASEKRNAHCDTLVVGAGRAGLEAARDAGRRGDRVMLIDDGDAPGGRSRGRDVASIAALAAELEAMTNVRRLARTLVTSLFEDGFALAIEHAPESGLDERLWRIRAREVVLATGAMERPLVFADNDRPGVMLLSAMRHYAERHGVACGRRVVVVTNNDGAYDDAIALRRCGVAVERIVDRRTEIGAARARAEQAGIEVLAGHVATGTHFARELQAVRIAARDNVFAERWLDCDALAMAGGWTPRVHLHSQLGGKLDYDAGLGAFVPGEGPDGVRSIGACAGDLPRDLEPVWESPKRRRGERCFVDVAADVISDDIRLAAREGFRSVEHMKRYTTSGMSLDQGRFGNANAFAVLAAAREEAPAAIGTTTFRPPFAPIAFGTIADRGGSLLLPARATPITAWNEAQGAVMYDVGASWRRPGYYPRDGEDLDAAVRRECLNARTKVGLYDGSPLGKFELKGRDVVAFLERLYCNNWADLAPGHGRYGLMLHEDGRLFDDGVGFRLAPDRFLIHTTTGNADSAAMRFEYFSQVEWPELEVMIAPVTTQWANLCVCGPLAREVMRAAGVDFDLDHAAFPFMTMREGRVAGVASRIARVSFTGELSFEINVPARRALELWEILMRVGAPFGIAPVGSEGSHVLRIEKGFISVGHEADGIADPYDLGLGWMVSKTKADFVGKRALERNRRLGGSRPQMVGLLGTDPNRVLPESAVVLSEDGSRSRGFVAASCLSPILERGIAIAMIEDGRGAMGREVTIARGEERFTATIAKPAFFDPKGERMRG
jgi:sarcosine oxidase subunit alpha